jgi:hypothetical protein
MQNIYNSKWFGWALGGIGVLILLLLVFRMGIYVGEKRENLANNWGENYGRFFGEPKPGFFPPVSVGPAGMEMNAFGNGGIVLKVDGNSLAIKGNDGNEKIIVTDSSTVVRGIRQDISLSDIKTGDAIVVLGEPNNNGQILAKLIRVFSPPWSSQTNSTSSN